MRTSRIASLVLGLGAVAAAPAHAQVKDGINVELFEPALGTHNFLTVPSADVLPHKQFGLTFYLDYQRDPFTIEECNPDCAALMRKTALVHDGFQAYLGGAFGIRNLAQVAVGLPVALSLSSNGTELSPTGTTSGAFSTTALGDVYLEGKLRLWRGPYGLGLAAAPGVSLPTASNKFAGEKNATGRLRAIASLDLGRFGAAADLGVLVRDSSVVVQGMTSTGAPSSIEIGSQLLYGGAASYAFPLPGTRRPLRAILELFGRHGFDSYLDSAPMEIDGALRFGLPHAVEASLGAGAGLVRGVGSPLVRAFFGLGWAPDFRDRDGDGVPDMDDKCPDQPEDRDGYQDEDGCPDPDNDGDGIPDALDKCPNDPEDMDGFQDADGCPDPDNDGDGIPDIKDACPNAKEDGKGKFPKDGCPEDVVDSDGDGIPDIRDKCPDEPEDKDGFQDEDGCPDPDNDNDGVPDQYDQCPNEPEDKDGFEDDDGCPDPDNDHDGVPDKLDRCPNEPETINGIKDDDGCPDAGPVHVKIENAEITVDEPILFSRPKLQRTAWLLDQLAQVLRGHDEITKLRIEAHKQAGESDAEAQRRAAAVLEYLSRKGVEAARLRTQVVATPGQVVQFFIEAKKDKRQPAVK